MNLPAALDALFSALAIGLAFYLTHLYWKRKALQRAREWAARSNLEVVESGPVKFAMHRQRPRVTFHAIDSTGSAFMCTLELKSSSFVTSPVGHTARVELLAKVKLSADA